MPDPASAQPAPKKTLALPSLAKLAQIALILLAGWFVYAPVLHGGWLWDDLVEVPRNPLLRDATGLWKIWTEPTLLFDFYPIKYSVQWLQWQLWQDHTFGYHLTNLGLHCLSALLFWRVLQQLGLRFACLGALLFTVHPLAVESVAWIAELKNTLSLPPLLLAVTAFLNYVAHGRRRDWLAALAWFIVKMLCKTSAVMLPVFLLVFLWWKRGKVGRRELGDAAPFFAVSLALGVVTLWFQHHRAIGADTFAMGGPLTRIAQAGTSLAFYFWKSVWPVGLLPIYPRWPVDTPTWWLYLPWVVFALVGLWLATRRGPWSRHVLLALAWFTLNLAPFLGLVTISYMRFTWVMDHFTYVPLLGLIALFVAGAHTWQARLAPPGRLVLGGAGFALCAVLACLARNHAGDFRDEETLWTYTTAGNPGAAVPHYNLGLKLSERGETAAARAHYETALRIDPAYAQAHNNLAVVLRTLGQVDDARRHLEIALRLKPTFADAHNNLGAMHRDAGRGPEAIAEFQAAVRCDPAHAEGQGNLGQALAELGRTGEAIAAFEAALRLNPASYEVHTNFASLLRRTGRVGDAVAHLQRALELKPDSQIVLFNLGNAQRELGQLAAAIGSYEHALQLKPDLAAAHHNLAISLHEAGRDAEARTHYEQSRQLDPSLPELHF